jgi:hypothetical protein
MIKDFLIMKREHPYGKDPPFWGKFDQKLFQKSRFEQFWRLPAKSKMVTFLSPNFHRFTP